MGKKIISILAAVLAIALVVVGILFIQAKQAVSWYQQDQTALIAKIAEMAAQIEALNTDITDKDSKIEALNADVADRDSQIDALNADVADKNSQIEALNADVADKNSQIEALNADVADKNSQIEALNADVADKDGKIADLSAELEQLRQSVPQTLEIPDSVPGEYATTRQFLYTLEQMEIDYIYNGIDDDGDECITIEDICAGHPVAFCLWFSPNCSQASLRVWDLISFTPQQENLVQIACGELNASYRFVTFYPSYDNTVTMKLDFLIWEDGNPGGIILDGLLSSYAILEDAYPALEPYDN